MDEMRRLAEFADDDGDLLSLMEADEDQDYLVMVQEVASGFDEGVTATSVAFHKDDLPAIVKVITDFINA